MGVAIGVATYGMGVAVYHTLWTARREHKYKLRLKLIWEANVLEFVVIWTLIITACVSALYAIRDLWSVANYDRCRSCGSLA